jgi:hypothetical protein
MTLRLDINLGVTAQGPQGAPGEKGAPGERGAQGEAGKIYKPYIDENGSLHAKLINPDGTDVSE